jgi:hypothetical protein
MPVYWSRWRTPMSGEARLCNVHGLFIATSADADLGFLMDVTIVMPTGPIQCTAVPRFVGDSPNGRGIGLELHVMDPGDRAKWNAFYRRTLHEEVTRQDR